ncbi:hypothetical protein [Sinorhizobium arboris]|uniref:hypothetical protein n=1 Tax=Sinorhizobium arboris TaxID=76745 RepID=UPI000422BB5C|nr:hypothetical protein [Sinorhizobium arboris]
MFYLGGMTLGYLVPPVRGIAARKPAVCKERGNACPDQDGAQGDGGREPEWAHAFLAPWHLFY